MWSRRLAMVLFAATVMIAGCSGIGDPAAAGYSIMEAQELQAKLVAGQKPVIVDLREPTLFRAGHIAGARNIPFEQFKQQFKELSPNAEIVLVCHAGPMGDESAGLLAEQGFSKVWNLKGGMAAWSGKLEK